MIKLIAFDLDGVLV